MNDDSRSPVFRPAAPAEAAPRPWIGAQFDCCGVYTRVYRRADQLRYVLRCPRCLRQTTIQVGEGGSSDRIFRVG